MGAQSLQVWLRTTALIAAVLMPFPSPNKLSTLELAGLNPFCLPMYSREGEKIPISPFLGDRQTNPPRLQLPPQLLVALIQYYYVKNGWASYGDSKLNVMY